MYETDFIISFSLMALLFLRQVSILKQPNKLNYSPLVIGVGVISTLLHFILHPEGQNFILLFRESLFPLLVSFILYMILNVMHQTQESENSRAQAEFSQLLVAQISQLRDLSLELEERIKSYQDDEFQSQEEIRSKFKEDIQALESILVNQEKFSMKFKDMDSWHKSVSDGLEHFQKVQMPEFDSVVHKHIDILRVAEQDHYNQLKVILDKAVENRHNRSEEIEELKESILSVKDMSDGIADSIVSNTLGQIGSITKAFESQIKNLKSYSEGIDTSLHEGENTLVKIREQSEIIMKQIVLSSNRMGEIEKQSSSLSVLQNSFKDLVEDIEKIKSDYVKSKAELTSLSQEMKKTEDNNALYLKEQINLLSKELTSKVDISLEKLHEKYNLAQADISQSVQILAKKAQLHKGYSS